ncbi:MAG: SUMF1/EgtB/PvdO family nonheme iron enzyme, partial [Planctomycetes bacterium]|nr:SUMF1/EgtB/PvdO family nonheme iron enzyme [Planctomycetota bacterium]
MLQQDMALVPAGKTMLCEMFPVAKPTGFEFVERPVGAQYVDAVYIDRHAVTNADFLRFIDDGSYKEVDDGRGGIIELNLLGNMNKCGVIKPRFSTTNETFEKWEKRYLPAKDFGILIVST